MKLPLRSLSGADHEAEIGPDIHQGKPVDFYVTATDRSGHQGQLGSAENPQRVKRKGILKRILDRDG